MIESIVTASGRSGLRGRAGTLALGLLTLGTTGLLGGDALAQTPTQRRQGVDWGALERGVSPLDRQATRVAEPRIRSGLSRASAGTLVTDDETGVEFLLQDPGAESASGDDGFAFEEEPDDGDYSPQALFQRLHGDFLRNAFFYRPNLKLTYRFQSARDVETDFAPASGLPNDRGDFDINEFDVDWNFNYAIDPDFYLITGLTFAADHYDFSGTAPQLQDETLYELSGKIGVGWFLTDDVLIQGYYAPGYYSDFDSQLNSNDVQNFGRVLSTVKLSDTFYVHGGVEVSPVFEDVPLYPLLGLTAILSEEWRVDILAPREAAIRYSPSPEWTFSGGLELDGAEFSYRTRPGVVATTPPSPFGSSQQDINIQEFRLFTEALYRANNQLSIYGRFGSTLIADYNYRVSNVTLPGGFVATGDFDGAVRPNVFLEVGLGFDL